MSATHGTRPSPRRTLHRLPQPPGRGRAFSLGQAAGFVLPRRLGATPWHRAYFGGTRMIVDLLQQSGADAPTRDDTLGCKPRSFGIRVSANRGFPFLVRARLAEDPTLVNSMDGRTNP